MALCRWAVPLLRPVLAKQRVNAVSPPIRHHANSGEENSGPRIFRYTPGEKTFKKGLELPRTQDDAPIERKRDPRKQPSISEKQYMHYVSKPIVPPKKKLENSSKLAAAPTAALEALPKDLRGDPLGVFARNDATVELVGLCLVAFLHSVDTGEDEAVREKAQQASQAGKHWTGFGDLENISLDEEPSFSDYHPSGHERQLWKSRLLLALVMSQARRPMQSESGIDSALKSYFRALDFSSKLKDLPAAFIPASAAGVWLSRILKDREGQLSSPPLFDRFIKSLSFWIKDKDCLELERGHLELFHPSESRADGALRFIRRCMRKPPVSDFIRSRILQPRSFPDRNHVFRFFLRTAGMLHRHGYVSDARAVLEFGKQCVPSMFAPYKHPKDYEPRQASAKELAEGVLVDSYGNRLLTKGVRELYSPERRLKFDPDWRRFAS